MSVILTCSNCQTKFLVDEQLLLPQGRNVACNRCHNQWFEPKPTHAQQQPNQVTPAPQSSAESNLQVQGQVPQEQTQSQQDIKTPTAKQSPVPKPQSVAQSHSQTPFTPPPESPPVKPQQAEMTRQDITQRLAHIRESVQSDAQQNGDRWDGHVPSQEGIPPFVTAPPHGGQPLSAQHSSSPNSSAQYEETSFAPANNSPVAPVEHKHLQRTRSWGVQMFVLLFVALLLAGVIAWVTKDKISNIFPELQPYYQMLGIETQAMNKGLVILEPTAKIETKDGQTALMISGVIENRHNQTESVPSLMAKVKDGKGVVLGQWPFNATAKTIPPQGTVPYTISIADPPERAMNVEVIFAPPS